MNDSEKIFDRIADDYEFFMDHSTESASDLDAYERTFAARPFPSRAVRALDFGCGTGRFTERWLDRLTRFTAGVELSLLEPARKQLAEASQRLASRSLTPIVTFSDLANLSGCYDLIVANHCLYYVPDVLASLKRLAAALDHHGLMIIAISGYDNALCQLWKLGFSSIDEPVPYHSAESVVSAFDQLGLEASPQKLTYEISFPDCREHREKLLRFLFDKHLQRMPLDPLLAFFDPYCHDGRVHLETISWQWNVSASRRPHLSTNSIASK